MAALVDGQFSISVRLGVDTMTLMDMVAAICLATPMYCADVESKKSPDGEAEHLQAASIPSKAQPYVELLQSISHNPSREAALTEQESNWNVKARSPYAKGLRQFTDSTGRWAAKTICRQFGSYKPYNPSWSLRCGVVYVEHLQRNNNYSGGYCFNRRVAEQEYNGGGWVIRELRRAGVAELSQARRHCTRARWACKENYEYPQRISKRQKKYLTMGGTHCPN